MNQLPTDPPPTAGQYESYVDSWLELLGVLKPPVPVERVAQALGVEIRRAVLGDDVSGLLVVKDGRGAIGVSATQSPVRQRFTIAHEIGHYVLHRNKNPLFIDRAFFRPYFVAYRDSLSAAGTEHQEREANAFAATLLMPGRLLKTVITETDIDVTEDDAVDALAKRFNVSRQAMSFRLGNLGIFTEAPSRRNKSTESSTREA